MRKLLVVAAVIGVVGAQGLQAQGGLPIAVEARGGFAFPTGEWNEEEELQPGVGFGITALVDVAPMVALYAGWERYSFGVDDDGALEGTDVDVVDSGARLGAEFSLPIPAAPVAPFVFGGATYSQVTLSASDDGAAIEFESDRTLGFEVGGGVKIPLGAVLTFTPAVRYGSHSAEFDSFSDLGAEETSVGRITVDLGLRFGF